MRMIALRGSSIEAKKLKEPERAKEVLYGIPSRWLDFEWLWF